MARVSAEDRNPQAQQARVTFAGDTSGDFMQLDPESLDPEKHYRFVNPRLGPKRHAQGYRPETAGEGNPVLAYGMDNQTEGEPIKVGDSILMSTSKEEHDRRREQREQLTRDKIASADQQLKQDARRSGVRSSDYSMPEQAFNVQPRSGT